MGTKTLRFVIEGGKATPGPPIGPALSPYKLNVNEVVKAINEATKEFEGLTVPVEVIIDTTTREFKVRVGVPTTTALLLRAAGASKTTGNPAHERIGNVSMEEIIKVAIMKREQLTAKALKSAVKTILGSARSLGITVDGKDPKEVQRLVDQGVYDELLKSYEEEWKRAGEGT
ncbi:MAG: 50S ribosomal protein L11 [Desulfurococcaceae archaeon]